MKVKGLDSIWLIGENFADSTVRQYFMTLNEENSYTHAIYEVKVFTCNSFRSDFVTTTARVRNNLATAFKTIVTPLPKMIVIVLEDDLRKSIKRKDRVERIYTKGMKWLFNEVRKMLDGHNDSLPKKAKKKYT